MSYVGRGTRVLALGVAFCLAATGCHFSVSMGSQKETPPADARKKETPQGPAVPGFQPDPAAQPADAVPPVGGTWNDAAVQPVAATDDPNKKPEDNKDGKPADKMADNGLTVLGPHPYHNIPPSPNLPTELEKTTLPPYVIEPPDILLIDAVRLVPRAPYRIEPLDVLIIQATETFPDQPIAGPYVVAPDGTISLGFRYGTVRVAGKTLEEAQEAVRVQLGKVLKNPQVSLGLGQFRGLQQIRGEHLVRMDGTISLGTYGCVYVAGMTMAQAKWVIEEYLSQFLQDPQVAVDVFAYNSKSYYIIFEGAGFGQQVYRFPITGNETVLDAISQVNGLPPQVSRKKMWVARPAPANHACLQILPVDWQAIVQGGSTRTNYQLFPGDRIYVRSDPLIAADNILAKILAPLERLMGFTLLTTSTIRTIENNNGNNGGLGFIVAP